MRNDSATEGFLCRGLSGFVWSTAQHDALVIVDAVVSRSAFFHFVSIRLLELINIETYSCFNNKLYSEKLRNQTLTMSFQKLSICMIIFIIFSLRFKAFLINWFLAPALAIRGNEESWWRNRRRRVCFNQAIVVQTVRKFISSWYPFRGFCLKIDHWRGRIWVSPSVKPIIFQNRLSIILKILHPVSFCDFTTSSCIA